MLIYIYDGSFEGLLTAIYEAYYRHQAPQNIIPDSYSQQCFFDNNVTIITDLDKSDRVYSSIVDKISCEALDNVYYVYLSEAEDAGNLIYNYLKLGWKMGRAVTGNLADDTVLKVANIAKRVAFEVHRIAGILRFEQIDANLYYAAVEPDNNIVALLAPHFADRLADQNWIIHDTKRNIAAVYNCKEWAITDLTSSARPDRTAAETHYQKLWKQYFKSIAISYRINPKLQKSHMPTRYWKNLTEKQLPD